MFLLRKALLHSTGQGLAEPLESVAGGAKAQGERTRRNRQKVPDLVSRKTLATGGFTPYLAQGFQHRLQVRALSAPLLASDGMGVREFRIAVYQITRCCQLPVGRGIPEL